MEKKALKISLLVIVLIFLPVNFTLSQRELELQYPEIGGETITATTSIPGFIKYIFNLSIIIAVIISIGVLILAGFLYLTSTGKPEQLKEAKSRIFYGFLGLIILLGSYLILQTVNPQLTVLEIKQLPLTWGVVLVNETARDAVGGIGNKPDLRELSNQIALGNAKQVISVSDFEQKFGEYNASTAKFEKFTPVALYILPEEGGVPNTHTKVVIFSEKNFKGQKREYSEEKDGCSSTLCPLDDFTSTFPPMSLSLKETGPGVYLYGKEPQEEFFTRTSISDLRGVKFNDKSVNDNVYSIAIKNKKEQGIKTTDYLAILHEKVNYGGQCRIFFEKRQQNNKIVGNSGIDLTPNATATTTEFTKGDKVKLASNADFDIGNKVFIKNTLFLGQDCEAIIISKPDNQTLKLYVPDDPAHTCPTSIGKGSKVTEYSPTTGQGVQAIDEYGEIGSDLPSSLHVFQIASEWSGTVTLCPATNYQPIKKVKSDGTVEIVTGCKTYSGPVWIPEYIGQAPEGTDKDLNDKIRSIEINGNFAVVLFENKPEGNGSWHTGHPGKCQVFTESHPDLTSEPIGSCNAHTILSFWAWAPCTSGIAIYPIK